MKPLCIDTNITRREELSVQKYFKEIADIPFMSAEEEFRIGMRAKNGDLDARNKLVVANLRFAVSIAKKYTPSNQLLSDYINIANEGLIKAASLYDPTRGFKFISFAVWWIRQNLLQYLYTYQYQAKLPMNKIQVINKLVKIASELSQIYEKDVTLLEAATIKKVPVKKGDFILNRDVLSLDSCFSDEDDSRNLLDILEQKTYDKFDTDNSKEIFRKFLKGILTDKEYIVVTRRFGFDSYLAGSFKDIGEEIGVCGESVKVILKKAIKKIKKYKGSEEFLCIVNN